MLKKSIVEIRVALQNIKTYSKEKDIKELAKEALELILPIEQSNQMQPETKPQEVFKNKYKYIQFVEGLKDEWTVWTNKSDESLGVITYNRKWKEWEFAPEERTLYTKQCLLDLADFINQLK